MKECTVLVRTSAARAVNRDLVLLYWDIGRGIVEKQQTAGWGEAVVERLAADLRAEFPDMRGFSVANLWRMKQFYLAHTSHDFLSQAVRVLKYADAGPEKLAQSAREFETDQRSTANPEFLAQAVKELAATPPANLPSRLLPRIFRDAHQLPSKSCAPGCIPFRCHGAFVSVYKYGHRVGN